MPVTSDTPANRSATFDVLICVVITGSHRPELSVFVQGLLANAPHVVTVVTCAAAFDEGRLAAEISTSPPRSNTHAVEQNRFITHVSCNTGLSRSPRCLFAEDFAKRLPSPIGHAGVAASRGRAMTSLSADEIRFRRSKP